MTSLTFPDLNVWLALVYENHAHRAEARRWWEADRSDTLGFTLVTQLGLLRLLTTAAVMCQRPLTMSEAWMAYDRLFQDYRVAFLEGPPGLETAFRRQTTVARVAPKLWADAWLLAFAELCQGTVVTFDRALAERAHRSLLLPLAG